MKPPVQGEMVWELLQHLDTHEFLGMDGIPPKTLREVLMEPLSIIFLQLWYLGRPQATAGSQTGQKGLEGGFRRLQACQPELSTRESHGEDHPGCREKHRISPSQLGFVSQGLPDHPDLLPWQQDLLSG